MRKLTDGEYEMKQKIQKNKCGAKKKFFFHFFRSFLLTKKNSFLIKTWENEGWSGIKQGLTGVKFLINHMQCRFSVTNSRQIRRKNIFLSRNNLFD